jgi:acyl-CoA dehydrogenase family member 9
LDVIFIFYGSSPSLETALRVDAHQSIGLKALLLFETEEKKRSLKPLARGEQLTAFALTEPNAGSDAGGVETKVVFDPKKIIRNDDGWYGKSFYQKAID